MIQKYVRKLFSTAQGAYLAGTTAPGKHMGPEKKFGVSGTIFSCKISVIARNEASKLWKKNRFHQKTIDEGDSHSSEQPRFYNAVASIFLGKIMYQTN